MLNKKSQVEKTVITESAEAEVARLREQLEAQSAMLEQTTRYMQKVQEQLEESEKLLRHQNSMLEDTVTQRTHELRQAVTNLECEIQERSRVQDTLEKTHEELNTLFYRSSHDFRSPICSSRGLINLLRKETENQGSLQYLNLLEDSLKKLDALTRTLTTIAEVRQGEINEADVQVSSLMDNIIAGYKYQYPQHRIVEDASVYTPWHTDPDILEQIVRKLLDNAFFYSGLQLASGIQPTVKLSLRETADQLIIEIYDNGPGIAEDVRPYVFNMFFRGHLASKGNGLGLYLAKLAAGQLGGALQLRNSEQGGLTVVVTLNR